MSPGRRRNRDFRGGRKCRAKNKFRATKSGFPCYPAATEKQGRSRWLIRTRIPASRIRPPDRNRVSSKAAARNPDSRVKANDRVRLVDSSVLREGLAENGGAFFFLISF